jgi:hypothetical protein
MHSLNQEMPMHFELITQAFPKQAGTQHPNTAPF